MSAHTPGPWVLFNKNGVIAVHKGAARNNKPVVGWLGFDSAEVGGHEVNVANARLIAAAPELLAFAREMVLRHDEQANEDVPPELPGDGRMTCGCGDCERAKEVIAKAEGRP